MKVQIEINDESGRAEPPLPSLAVIEAIAETIWEAEAVKDSYQISILFCDDEAIRVFNRQYRGSDKVTDVLSFKTEIPSNESGTRSYLCDIIIDTNYIYANKGLSGFHGELEQVLIHSLLHLLDYDHIKTSDKESMESKEQKYLKKTRGQSQSGRR